MDRPTSEKMLVEGQGKTYAQLLKDIKLIVDVDSFGSKDKKY